MTRTGRRLGSVLLALALVAICPAGPAGAQTPDPPVAGTPADPPATPSADAPDAAGATPPASDVIATPPPDGITADSVERVKKILESDSPINLSSDQLAFYLRIIGRQPMTFSEYAKGSDLMNGPTRRGNPMSHQEFLAMVTPKEIYGSGGITASELLQFALTNYLGRKLLARGIEEIKRAHDEREARQIRERIERELEILRASGRN